MNTYTKYQDSNYVILQDGRPARLLKATQIHKQEYFNFVLKGKQKRVSLATLRKIADGSYEPDAQKKASEGSNS